MRHALSCMIALCLAVLCSCAGDQSRDASHTVTIPPSQPTVSTAQESIIAQSTQASVDERVDAANYKTALADMRAAKSAEDAAKTEADRAAAMAKYEDAEKRASAAKAAQTEADARATASDAELAKQRQAQLQGQADRFYWLACFLALAAGFMVYEKNMSCASRLGVLAAICGVIPSLVGGILAHELLIRNTVLLILMGELVYHFRAKEKVLLGKIEADGKAAAIAVEHAMAHDFSAADAWTKTHHPILAVEHILTTAYQKIRTDAGLMLAKLHLVKSPSAPAAAPVSPPVKPPTPEAP